MNEEKSMIEYKEQKGILNWLKSKFEKLKERFRPVKEVKKEEDNEVGLSIEELEKVQAGYPNPNVIDFDERKATIESLGKKSWELTEEQKEIANSQTTHHDDELSIEELEEIKAGMPIVEDEQR